MRRTRLTLLLVLGMLSTLLPLGVAPAAAAGPAVFVNEIHYDNTGADVGEAVEIAGPAGTDLSGWSVAFYNGSSSQLNVYATLNLGGTIPDQQAGFGTLSFTQSGIQNGSPDGWALVDPSNTVVEFLSYEGAFTAAAGPATGMTSVDIGVSEASGSAVGDSLQLTGSGFEGGDFTWAASQPNTFGAINSSQTFVGPGDVAPVVSSTTPANGATGVSVDSDITVNFSEPVTVTDPWFDILCTASGTVGAAASGGPTSYTLDPGVDLINDEVCTVTLSASAIADQDIPVDNMAANYVWSFTVEPPPLPVTKIHEVQGAGAASLLVGQTVAIEGIVVGDFQDDVGANGDLNGFHVQEEDADVDSDALTSEGIFVFQGSNPSVDVAIGDLVRVEGSVSEFRELTEITSFSGVTVLSSGNPIPTPASVTLPVAAISDLEAFEGMSVIFEQDLVITEYFNYDRFGQIVLSSERHLQPTAVFEPGSVDAADAADLILRDRIILDDGLTSSNPQVTRHPNGDPFSLTNLFSGGDTVTDAVGVMDFAFGNYAIQPTGPAIHADTNPREATPEDVGGDVTVASFNVLNYYTTIDQSGASCFPSFTRNDCRGADSAEELERQRAKIIVALSQIDADVVGLIEIENNVNDDAVIDLVSGLNDAVGAGTYDYVPAGTTGTDTIKVAFIYKPDVVSLTGAHAILDSAAFLDPANTGVDRNRAALAQTFTENATGESFTAVVNHFKSKSGSEIDNSGAICVDGDPSNDIPDCDQGDGQAYFNHTRTLAAQVLSDWLATDPTGSGDPDVLVIGDLNAYDKEDPIDVMVANGYADLVYAFQGESAYSFVFNGQIGYLDYGMANEALLPAVTGTTVWHLNSDEPDLLDYDTSFKSNGQDAIFDGTSPFRSSDHDPVIIGLNLANPMGDKEGVADDLAALLPTGDNNTDKRLNKAIDNIDASLNPGWWTSDQTITDKKVFDNERQAVAQLDLIVDGGGPESGAALDAILTLVNADRQLAQIELIAAIDRGGKASKIADAQQAMADAAAYAASGLHVDAINAYKAAWDAANKA